MKLFSKQIAFLLIIAVSISSCKVDVSLNSVNGNKNVTTQDRNITEAINSIEIQEGVTVFITMSDIDKMTVEADENLHEVIKTEIKDGNLKIFCNPNIKYSKARNIHLSISEINSIESSSGSRVISENTLFSKNISLKSSSGSSMDLQVSTTNLYTDSSSGSTIKLKGKTTNLNTESSSGSSIEAYNLSANNVDAKSSSGSHTTVTVTEKLKAKASSGSSINHKGNPKNIEKKASSGGNVSAR